MTKVEEIESQWRGLTAVKAMRTEYDEERGSYDLTLLMARELGGECVEIVFKDVGAVNIQSFGGGLSQLLYLRVIDESERGLERIKYTVRELERDAISLTCSDITVLPSR